MAECSAPKLARWKAFARLEAERIEDEIANRKAGGTKPGVMRPMSEIRGKFAKKER